MFYLEKLTFEPTPVREVAILCAAKTTVYKTIPKLDVFDIERDARSFRSDKPVVAHPPCRSWSAFLSHQAKPLPGEKELAPLCVEFLRKCGGILEHPAHSNLWKHLDLPRPGDAERNGLWSVEVNQSWWGDERTKKTWLLVCGVQELTIPVSPHDSSRDKHLWAKMSTRQRAATPVRFANWLVDIARRSRV